ncbi:T-lymphoma invasion and metastasis-inducing protein 2-like isoform X2 [Sander lucioperca]|uniref:T-lymphoma invasion and metastasis-inducing protein 2-like isoform X2 n=1 Tax=Sander lucioperca TaxID=283035 RepID=UPI001653E321|nr:T-lymphoma invasion and metastasis-inducing protein 2-like isoform X2 [Sander lucioperca]
MGNTDSHSSFVSPAKSPCSLRLSSCRREETPSARSWWRSNQGRSRGRNYLKPQVTGPPYTSWHYEPAPTPGAAPPRFFTGSTGQSVECTSLQSDGDGSPKVMLGKDGSMRVEFTNARGVSVETQGLPLAAAGAQTAVEPSLRTSKGSSLSSDGSWYDSPWGPGGELADNVFVCTQSSGYAAYSSARTEDMATGSSGYNTVFSAQVDVSPGFNASLLFPAGGQSSEFCNTCSSGRTEDSGIGDSVILPEDFSSALLDSVYQNTQQFAFPTAPDAPAAFCCSTPRLDEIIAEEEGSGVEQRYSSLTLPCRRAESVGNSAAAAGNSRKDFLKSRIRRLSDWTGSLSRKKRRIQEPYGSESSNGCNLLWSSNPLHAQNQSQNQNQVPAAPWGSSRSLNQNQNQVPAAPWGSSRSLTQNQNQVPAAPWGSSRSLTQNQNQVPAAPWGSSRSLTQNQSQSRTSDAQRQNVYENFMQELETGAAERTEPSDGEEGEEEMEGEEEEEWGGGGQLDFLFETEQGAVRRAGWLSFKALITVGKDRKLELVARRKWKHYWVTLKGCSLLFYETYGKTLGAERELSPRYALLADDSIVQAVPEHPKKEHVFCLSNSHGDVYLFQATTQTDLENWVTAIHSASAALLAKRRGTEDTLRLLRVQSGALLHSIDMDAKMKKMAELQLSVIREPRNRKAVESQIQQWEQNLEKLNLDLFRLRCYQSSLQGGELPNPKSLLAVASRPSKSMLGRLGVFSVSSFHALVCSRDEGTLRRRSRSLSGGCSRRRGLPSSLRALDAPKRRSRDARHSTAQVIHRTHHGPGNTPHPPRPRLYTASTTAQVIHRTHHGPGNTPHPPWPRL